MKKLTLLLFSIYILTTKHTFAQIGFSIKSGTNFSTLAIKDADFKADKSVVIGIPIGISSDIKLYRSLYIQPSLNLSRKGFKSDNLGFGNNFKAKVSYLEVPINFLYKKNIELSNLIVGLGVYGAYGLDGEWSSAKDVLIGDISIGKTGDINFQNDAVYNDYGNYIYGKPWDYGVTALIGYEIQKKYLVQINSSYGIRNITSSWGDFIPDYKEYNRTFALTIGYIF